MDDCVLQLGIVLGCHYDVLGCMILQYLFIIPCPGVFTYYPIFFSGNSWL